MFCDFGCPVQANRDVDLRLVRGAVEQWTWGYSNENIAIATTLECLEILDVRSFAGAVSRCVLMSRCFCVSSYVCDLGLISGFHSEKSWHQAFKRNRVLRKR